MNAEQLIEIKFAKFGKYLEENPKKYTTLSKYRKLLAADTVNKSSRRKLKLVETQMKSMLEAGVSTKRRKPGSGERVEVEHTYKDTPSNRKLERVGQTYIKVEYKDAEFEENTRTTMRRRKRQARGPKGDAPVRRNLWIESVEEAKTREGAPKFIILRKTVPENPTEADLFSNKVYLTAMEIMSAKKTAAAAEAAKEVPAEPTPVEEETKQEAVAMEVA